MTAAAIVDLATLIAMTLLGVAVALALIRVLVGPTMSDRVLALDLLNTLLIGFIATFAARTGVTMYLDLAIALGLVGFLSTVAFARYVMHRQLGTEGNSGGEANDA